MQGSQIMLNSKRKTIYIIFMLTAFIASSCINNGARKSMPKKKPLPCPVKDC